MAAGSADLGNAKGRIEIDVSDLLKLQSLSQQIGRTVANNLGQIDTAAKNTQKSFSGTAAEILKLGAVVDLGSSFVSIARGMGQLVIESDKIATSYNRQKVAAVSLAGSQEKLNELLSTYDRVTGGAVDKATALSDVTRLQAIGFADSASELEKFVTAARGISIATGKSQDYVVSELTQSIANQSTRRLDQIALSVDEVQKRIEDLKRADGSLTQEQAYQNAVLGLAVEKYGKLSKSVEGQATGAEKAEKAWKDLKLQLGETLGGPTGGVLTGLSAELNGISGYLKGVADDAHKAKVALDEMRKAQPGTAANAAGQVGGAAGSFAAFDPVQWVRDAASQLYGVGGQAHTLENYRTSLLAERASASTAEDLAQLDNQIKQVDAQLAVFRAQLQLNYAGSTAGANNFAYNFPRAGAASPGGFTEDQTKLIVEHQRALNSIEADAASARQEATASYEQQRTETIRQYEQTIAREAQDYGRQRARAEQQLQKQLGDITAEQKSRESQYAIDLADSIADITNDGNQRIAELEHDFQKQRERAQEEHNDRLFEAVGNLDAKALAEESRRYARSGKQAEEDFSDRIAKEKEQINQRVQDEIDANEKRIQEGRKNDLQRSIDLQQSFDDQRRQEDEDRQIRLTRMAEDHQAQLDQMDAAQGQRLQQIDDHAAQERTQLDDEFVKQLTQLGIHNTAWETAQKNFQDESLRLYKEWWEKRLKLDNAALAALVAPKSTDPLFGPPSPGIKSNNSFFPGFASGGPVTSTGLALVHAGEYVLNKRQMDYLGGSISPLMSGGNKTLNIADNAIVINAGPGQSAGDIGEAVKMHLMDLITSL